jgi:NAD(P)H dehydrogenase (quinone)
MNLMNQKEYDMKKVAIVYHSGYGHTTKAAEAVQAGVAANGAAAELILIDAEGNITEAQWASLAAADAIVFGSPTYMGTVSWQFKKFADASSNLGITSNGRTRLQRVSRTPQR